MVWVPPKAAAELIAARREYESQVLAMVSLKGVLDEWNRELRQIDPYLQLVRAQDTISVGTPLRPGFYHVIRHNPGAPPTIMTIEGPNGEFVEPNSGVYEMLRRQDWQDPRVMRAFRRKQDEMRAAEQRRLEREREDRQQEILERFVAGTRTQVLMSPDVRWAQNRKGYRGRKPGGTV